MKKRRDDETSETAEQAYRITWSDRTPVGRWTMHQLVQYARSESLAVNQALAKIRHDYPHGVVVACDPVIPGSPVTVRREHEGQGPTPEASGD